VDIGVSQAEKPVLGKESIGPLDVIEAAGDPRSPELLAQEIAQPPADPAVKRSERRAMAVLEVFKPAAQRRVEVLDDLGQAVSRCAFGRRPDRILELLQTLGARPATAGREPVAQEVEAVFRGVDQPRLGRMQAQAGVRRPVLHCRQGCGRLLRTPAQHHKVVRISHHLKALRGHQMVERVEVNVAQQRTAHRTLRRALFGGPFLEPVEHPLFQERLDQPEKAAVRHLLPDQGEKTVLGNCVEIALQIGVDDVDVAGFEQAVDPPQRVPRFREGRLLQPRLGRKP